MFARAGRSRDFMGGAGADIFTMSRSRKQKFGAGAEVKWLGSATLFLRPGSGMLY